MDQQNFLKKEKIEVIHCVINEKTIVSSMFDPKISTETLGPRLFLIIYQAAEAVTYNNECPAEQIGSQFGKQTFGKSSSETASDRGLIAVNGDAFAGTRDLMKKLSTLTKEGVPEWNISKVKSILHKKMFDNFFV